LTYPSSTQKTALDLYRLGLLPAEIEGRLGVHRTTVQLWAKAAGVARSMAEMRSRISEIQRQTQLQYTLNEATFEGELTPGLAWALGVIAGDGCVIRHKDVLQGVEVLGDEDVCQKVTTLLGSNAPVHDCRKDKRPSEMWRVRFHSPRLAASLKRFGIVPDKSRVLKWPALPEELESHFVRGLWDSDGSVTHNFSSVGTKYLVLSLELATKPLLEGVRKRLHTLTDSRAKVVPAGDDMFSLGVSSQKAKTFGEWIWKGSTPETRGVRKHALFEALKDVSQAKRVANKVKWDKVRAQVKKQINAGRTIPEVVERLGLNRKTVEYWARTG
jgi:transposase